MANGHGGPRPNSGRKPGSPNKAKAAQATYTKVEGVLADADIPAFAGDALAFLVWCYKNEDLPIGFRADCARAALPFEKPRLQSTELTGKDGGPILLEQIAMAAMAAREKQAPPPPPPKPKPEKPADAVVH